MVQKKAKKRYYKLAITKYNKIIFFLSKKIERKWKYKNRLTENCYNWESTQFKIIIWTEIEIEIKSSQFIGYGKLKSSLLIENN